MAFIHFLLFLCVASALGYHSDIISDIGGIGAPAIDEKRALEIKSEQFWELIKDVAKDAKLYGHLEVYAEVEAALADMPKENEHVKGLLAEALLRLRRADEKVLEQTARSSALATEKLATGPGAGGMFSFMKGGQNFLSTAIQRFVGSGSGRYTDKVAKHVAERQGDILPTLRGAATVTGGVLEDCRLASKLSFDVLKYDIYNKGVPKTTEAAKAASYRLVDAAGQTRRHFMQGIVSMANALAQDTQEKDMDPSAKVTHSLFAEDGGSHGRLQPFGAKIEAPVAVGATKDAFFIEVSSYTV